jgi:hypothetical protein
VWVSVPSVSALPQPLIPSTRREEMSIAIVYHCAIR